MISRLHILLCMLFVLPTVVLSQDSWLLPKSENNKYKTGLTIEKIEFNNDATILYLTFDNSYRKSGWINLNRNCIIKAYPSGKKYSLMYAEGISYAPNKYYLKSEYEIVKFKCVFPGVPDGTMYLDWIEKDGWQIYDIKNRLEIPVIKTSVYGNSNVNNKISSVTATQYGKDIQISYKLSKKANIMVSVSTDGGKNYSIIKKVTGDVGKDISPGDKTIRWKVLEEYEKFNYENVCFKVEEVIEQKKQVKNKNYNLSNNNTTYRNSSAKKSYSSQSNYKKRIYEPFCREQGNFEFTTFGMNTAVGTDYQLGVSALRFRYKWFELCPAELSLGFRDFSELYLSYQPFVNFLIPVKYNGAFYFGIGPNLMYWMDYEELSFYFKMELGYRYYWGRYASSEFFFRYDGGVEVGISLQL